MNLNSIELAILIKGRSITEYRHQGQTFVEGRAGSEYEIEIRNHGHSRVEAVLSVDGLSVIDGKAAGPQSSGYLVDAGSSIRVPGWKVDAQTIAKFAFSGHDRSYTQLSESGDPTNNGVIGLMAFVEKPNHRLYPIYQTSLLNNNKRSYSPKAWGSSGISNTSTGLTGSTGPASNVWNNMSEQIRGIAASSWNACSGPTTSGVISPSASSINCSAVGMNATQSNQPESFLIEEAQLSQINHLGTSFGEAADFATTTVQFERGDMLSYQVMYYDDIRGLRARGVIVERRRQKVQPNAFPAMQTGCTPPKNWRR